MSNRQGPKRLKGVNVDQNKLWHEYAEDALADLVKALGGPKAVGHKLMPDLALDDARRQVDAWCDRSRKEKPSLSQIMWILEQGRRADCHVLMHFLADRTGYETPEPINPKDVDAMLQRAFIDAVARLDAIQAEMKRNRVRAVQGAA